MIQYGMGKGRGAARQNVEQTTSSSSGSQTVAPESATATRNDQRSRSSQPGKQRDSFQPRAASKSADRKKVQWWWNRADNPWQGRPIWLRYGSSENTKIETACDKGWPEFELDDGDDPSPIRVVNFKHEIQHQRNDTSSKQTQVRRVEGNNEPDKSQIKGTLVLFPHTRDTYSRTEEEASE
jgi:hypothetical protein